MKKILLILILLFTIVGFSQPISVSTSAYTPSQLVNDVLINSACVSAQNISWSTGTNFSSSNGIGYFQNTNPNFPMKSGVVLSTGNVTNAPGPNTSVLNDGSSSLWLGDSDLENAMAASNVPMVSKNATSLEFDFTPISPFFSFDFIFVSEEYGHCQCLSSDAFAFLLTNTSTGVTKNLALVPNTNTPISVKTIRDFTYNSACPSANQNYFGSFNGGSNASSSATNFNGQTTVMTAKANLIPGVTYHIKLVVADGIDNRYDSAIFLSSNSFNMGQNVLGENLTITDNTALCYGQPYSLDTGLDTSKYNFQWEKDNIILSGESNPTLTINAPGKYAVTYTNIVNSCSPFTDEVTIEYYPKVNVSSPNDLYRCNTGLPKYTYNLSDNTPIVMAGLDPNTAVSYHASQSDADKNIKSLPFQYNGIPGETIFVRVQPPNNPCWVVKSFKILTALPPTANKPEDLIKCSKNATDTAVFNLNPQTAKILNGQSSAIYSVTYYNSSNDANNSVNSIKNLSNGSYPSKTIYARVENKSDNTCFSITSFELVVSPGEEVDVLPNVYVCAEFVLPALINGEYYTGLNGTGTKLQEGDAITENKTIYIYNNPGGVSPCPGNSSFKVSIISEGNLAPSDVTSCASYTLPKLAMGNYYTGPSGTGAIIQSGTVITTSKSLYYYYKSPKSPYCTVDTKFSITINPAVNVGRRPDVFECTSYQLPHLTLGKYYTGPGGTGNLIADGAIISTSQTIYVYEPKATSDSCSDEDEFEIFIGMTAPQNISQCNGYTLPILPVGNYYTQPKGQGKLIAGGTTINKTTTLYVYAPTTSGSANCTDNMNFTVSISQPIDTVDDVKVCDKYILPVLTNGEYFTQPLGQGTQLYPGHIITTSQTIYVFSKLNSSCYNQGSFTITLIPLPNIDSRSDIDICDEYTLTPLSVGTYFTGPNGTGQMLTAGTKITTSQVIYIYASTSTTPPCFIENSFKINIFSITADAPSNVTACDAYTLPALSQDNKYYTLAGGPYGSGTEIIPGTVITSTQTIFVYRESLIRTSFSCTDENEFTVTINKTPIVAQVPDVSVCGSYILPALIVGNYYTGPNGTGSILKAGDAITNSQTIYIYAHQGTTPDCYSQSSFEVSIFKVDQLKNATICGTYNLPNLISGSYYTGPNGTGNLLAPGTTITSSKTLYVFGTSPLSPFCTDEVTFTITIVTPPVINNVLSNYRTTCDEDGKNDGITYFNLSNLSTSILGSQTSNEFSVEYYESLQDSYLQTNQVTYSRLSTVYVRVNNVLAPTCYVVQPMTLFVNKLPEPTAVDGAICMDNKTGALVNPYVIYSGLSPNTHKFTWLDNNGKVVGTQNNLETTLPGVYTLEAKNTITGCSAIPIDINVVASEPAKVTYEVKDDFSDIQSIIITATGTGNNFEFQMDNGNFQDSPIFEDVTSGTHQITVRDKYGCGSTTILATVISYPKFFTPNNDGYNDTWNIGDLSGQPYSYIYIYDRNGKLLKKIMPHDNGWDGLYNGHELPSDDYWFSVFYKDENSNDKEFRSHFAMKR